MCPLNTQLKVLVTQRLFLFDLIPSFVRLLVVWLFDSYIMMVRLLFVSFVRWLVRSFVHVLVCSLACSFVCFYVH